MLDTCKHHDVHGMCGIRGIPGIPGVRGIHAKASGLKKKSASLQTWGRVRDRAVALEGARIAKAQKAEKARAATPVSVAGISGSPDADLGISWPWIFQHGSESSEFWRRMPRRVSCDLNSRDPNWG